MLAVLKECRAKKLCGASNKHVITRTCSLLFGTSAKTCRAGSSSKRRRNWLGSHHLRRAALTGSFPGSCSETSRTFESRPILSVRRDYNFWTGFGKGADRDDDVNDERTTNIAGRDELARREEEVLATLSAVAEPNTGKDVIQLGLVQDLFVNIEGGVVTFTLRLPTLALPGRDGLGNACEEAVRKLPWVDAVAVTMKARRPRRQSGGRQPMRTEVVSAKRAGMRGANTSTPGLDGVGEVVCVSSCKGGVGKSTVAVNLAYALAAKGATVGLLDADIYGPSLPTMINPSNVTLQVSPAYPDLKLLTPVSHRGVSCMSFGWVNPKAGVPGAGGRGAAVMRGPIVTKVINQLLLGTAWGELEYLIIDMPPGTGDIQITLCQSLQMTGAVVVTTPQKLSYVDVVKGIEMFGELKVPVFSVVENMAFFDCDHGHRHRPFGPGHASQLIAECGMGDDKIFRLPLSPTVAAGSDSGDPVVLSDPSGEEANVYNHLADSVVREAFRVGEDTTNIPEVAFKTGRGIVVRYYSDVEATEYVIPAFELRSRDPATAQPLSPEQVAMIPEDVAPETISIRGNYAVSITWSDGHRGAIYSFKVLRKVAEAIAATGAEAGETSRS